MKYDAAVFDLFGTLVDNPLNEERMQAHREMANVLSIPVETVQQEWWKTMRERDAGIYGGVREDIKHICNQIGLQLTPEQVEAGVKVRLGFYRQLFNPRPGAVEMLTRLKEIGLKLALVSDCGYEVSVLWEETFLASLIDVPVLSCREKVVKPNPRIYQIALERLGVEPSRCLYVGDGGSRELTGALKLGMNPILIRVDYDHELDPNRPDALEWRGPVITKWDELIAHIL